MIKILIADDIQILRQGLKAILLQDNELEVVGLASNGKEAFKLCDYLNPDIVLMDMRMPHFDGEYGIIKIKETFPNIKILVLTTFNDDETISKAMGSGADGYILKEMENEKIIQSIKSVYNGINVFGGNAYSCIQKKFKSAHSVSIDCVDLTERETQIMVLLTQGCDNKEIAQQLFLAEGTVRNNISHMLKKLKLKDRTQLAVFAVKNNLV